MHEYYLQTILLDYFNYLLLNYSIYYLTTFFQPNYSKI